MQSLMPKTCAVLITKHRSLKGCQLFFYLYWLSFYRSDKFHYWKIHVTCWVRDHHKKSILNNRIRQHPLVNVLATFHGKLSILHTIYFYFNLRGGIPWKNEWVYMSCPPRGIGQLKKPPANETSEPRAFTMCKLELHSKAIMLQSHLRCPCFRWVANN